ncbi:hypothetical protein X975_22312, partial [Stegodyphus mimosarum]
GYCSENGLGCTNLASLIVWVTFHHANGSKYTDNPLAREKYYGCLRRGSTSSNATIACHTTISCFSLFGDKVVLRTI